MKVIATNTQSNKQQSFGMKLNSEELKGARQIIVAEIINKKPPSANSLPLNYSRAAEITLSLLKKVAEKFGDTSVQKALGKALQETKIDQYKYNNNWLYRTIANYKLAHQKDSFVKQLNNVSNNILESREIELPKIYKGKEMSNLNSDKKSLFKPLTKDELVSRPHVIDGYLNPFVDTDTSTYNETAQKLMEESLDDAYLKKLLGTLL